MKTEIDISHHIKELLNRNNVQVYSLELIDEALKQDFIAGQKKALVLYRSKIFERSVGLSGNHSVEVMDVDLPPHLKTGERVLVVLPSEGKTRFVMQTAVDEIFADRFGLRILDPRHDQRYEVENAQDIGFWPMPPALYMHLQNGQISLVRELQGPIVEAADSLDQEAAGSSPSELREYLVNREEGQPSETFQNALSVQPCMAKSVENISLGGVYLSAPNGMGEKLENQLIYGQFYLPAQGEAGQGEGVYGAGLQMRAFAIVRSWDKKPDGDYFHLMFLAVSPIYWLVFSPDRCRHLVNALIFSIKKG